MIRVVSTLSLVLILGMVWWWQDEPVLPDVTPIISEDASGEVPLPVAPVPDVSEVLVSVPVRVPLDLPASVFISGVPFTVQAPNAQWGNPLFQDACEEASIIMAAAWVQGGTLSREMVTSAVLTLVEIQQKQFGQAIDTSLPDTAWLLGEYAGITGVAHTGISVDDIRQALARGEIVIVPTDGRLLRNPHFTQPGPPRHMLVVTGYDTHTDELVVNDPGTRHGQGYRYASATLYEAITDYATGDHVPVTSTDKVMLTVKQD